MTHRKFLCSVSCVLSLLAAGCFKTNAPGVKNSEDGDSGRVGRAAAGSGGANPSKPTNPANPTNPAHPAGPAADPLAPRPQDPAVEAGVCVRGGSCTKLDAETFDKADLLFVVDNSGSMRQEQASLREQFPKLVQTLTSGRTVSGERLPQLRDLHLGVVSTDMGLAGIASDVPGCNTQRHVNGGDDGVLQHPGNTGSGCQAMYPPFLSFQLGHDDPDRTSVDFGCIANLGTTGCGFEQQLEAGLKALWPKHYIDADRNIYVPEKNPILFLSTTPEGRFGHGDVPSSEGGNRGFEREDALLAIVIVTDEEDCSSKNTGHFVSTNDPANPLSKQGFNLRCYYNRQNQFELVRYVKGYPALKPGREDTVLFAVIAGVPQDLVSAEAREGVNFEDQAERDAYYERILWDTRMLEWSMNETEPAISDLKPSCTRNDRYGERADAYAPRRMVEVAKALGANATVQSICQDDLGPAIDGLIDLTKRRTQQECLSEALKRPSDGKVKCDVLWQLPLNFSEPAALANCADIPFLSEVSSPRDKHTETGRLCKVAQLAVTKPGVIPRGSGWFYDDFSDEREGICKAGAVARIAFSEDARPPAGVKAYLDCAN